MLKCKTFIPTLSKLTRTCRRVLLWSHATHTYLSTQTLIRSSGCFRFTVIARTSLLVPANISFSLSLPVQTKPSTRIFSQHQHSPHKITCPTDRRLLSSVAAYIGQLVDKDIHFSSISPTQAYLATQTLSSFCRDLHRPTCPCGHFLFTDIARTGQLVHTDVSFSLLQPAEAYLTTQTLSF